MHWDPFTGIDLDHAVEDGTIAPWAQVIVDHFHSYTEWSPSHAGLHIWIRGVIPGTRCRKERIELYDHRRSLTITGWHLDGMPLTIEERQPELDSFYAHLFKEEQRQVVSSQPQVPTNLSDADLIARATQARNGARFARLWSGDTRDYDEDRSRADLALCGMLAFWCGGDAAQIDRLFRRSGLMRAKWDQRHNGSGKTYGQMTIEKAIGGQSTVLVAPRLRRSSL